MEKLMKAGIAVGLTVVLLEEFGVARSTTFAFLLTSLLVYLSTVKREKVQIFLATLGRDLFGAKTYARMVKLQRRFMQETKSIHSAFRETVQRHPNKLCLVYQQQKLTFRELDQLSSRIALVLRDTLQLKASDSIALLMPNKPEYVAVWLGASKAGCVTALLNINIRHESLLHSIKAAKCSALLYDTELTEAVEEIRDRAREIGVRCFAQWQHGSMKGDVSVADEIAKLKDSDSELFEPAIVEPTDAIFYIYTSGTTGLPKAAVVRHFRFFFRVKLLSLLMKFTDDDVLYNPLPLYHTSGCVLAVGCALVCGNTVVIRSKFSASQFWDECIANKCTIAIYIGELCRYLLAQPPKASDTGHSVRLMVGNGLRMQIWKQFQKRFQVRRIGEFYGATEGNAGLLNYSNKLGSCGFLSQIFARPIGLVKLDEDGLPVRGPDGLCILCKPGEPGQLLSGIVSTNAVTEFDGYTDPKATEQKIISDVFSKGDRAFLTGDVLVMDKYGFVYFLDRIGDTFRWKGENVSTNEVESALSELLGVDEDVAVYGVQLPACEGRAGMAALTNRKQTKLDSVDFFASVQRTLPAYAQPIFLRVVNQLETTGTFKNKKTDLRKLGFMPDTDSKDQMVLFADKQNKCYRVLDLETYRAICNGSIRF